MIKNFKVLNFFDINFEFNHSEFDRIVDETSLHDKGFCCFVDANSLAYSYKNELFKEVLNSALVNSCDGSYIALLASSVAGVRLNEYTGPDFFKKFIYKPYSQLIIGNTYQVFNRIKEKLRFDGVDVSTLYFVYLPHRKVEEFNYDLIASEINVIRPRLIWVSLGAPKQELFMFNLLPYVNTGVMLGVGAALNYFAGEVSDIPKWAKKFHLIWLFRIFVEPRKQLFRLRKILLIIPKLYITELINRRFINFIQK